MKRIILLVCAFLTLAYLDVLLAQDVNFSGTWVLAKDKSTLTGRMWERLTSMTVVIAQSGSAVKIETKVEGEGGPGGGQGGGPGGRPGGMNSALEFTIGGEASQTEGPRGGKVVVKGSWAENHKDLVVDTDRTIEGNMGTMTMKVNDIYSLSADGATLTVNRKSETPRGTMENKLVFAKQ